MFLQFVLTTIHLINYNEGLGGLTSTEVWLTFYNLKNN